MEFAGGTAFEPGAMTFAGGHAELGSTALAWLWHDLRPRMIVRDPLEVVWDNAAARILTTRDGGLMSNDGILSFPDDATTSSLATFLHATGPQMSTMAIPFARGAGHYLFRGWRIVSGDTSLSCLEICIDHKDFVPIYSDFERVFRLTPTERSVVLALLAGSSVAQIASQHRISIVTVRSHVKKVYAKIGVISREQLFSRLRPFRVI